MTAFPLLRAPLPWFGGKRRIASLVWSRFGDVPNYCEPFAGSLAVLLGRPHEPHTETVNDLDCYLANFWRALQADPGEVARYADWPVNEADLHARHVWLVDQAGFRERMKTDPDYHDAKIAGWWVWGICAWIAQGWCSREYWTGDEVGADSAPLDTPAKMPHLGDGGRRVHRQARAAARRPTRQLPALSDGGMGVHRPCPHPAQQATPETPPIQLPHLGNRGMGVHRPSHGGASGEPHAPTRQLPHLGDGGRGGHLSRRPAPSRQLVSLNNAGRGDARRAQREGDLYEYLGTLSARLRRVRVACGEWDRILGPAVTFKHGVTGVLLDPPYSHEERDPGLYATESDVSGAVREWALEHGGNPLLRIALCGYDGEHEMPPGWEKIVYKVAGGYGSQGTGRGRKNSARECVWFSPHCVGNVRGLPMFAGLDVEA